MAGILAAFDAKELILVVIALAGLVPVALQYREGSRLFAVGYGMLVLAALSTNVEEVFMGDLMNVVEHAAGLMGSALVFAAAAYLRRRDVIEADEEVPAADG